jgi:hypothetical protein
LLRIVAAEAFDGSEDIVGGFGPSEALWVGLVMADEIHDVGAQLLNAAVNAASYLFVGEESKQSLDLIEPRLFGKTSRAS